MATKYFKITKHFIPASHIREHRGATRDDDSILQLAVNQYTPLSHIAANAQQITIIGAHANAFPKVGILTTIFMVHLDSSLIGALRATMGRPVCVLKGQKYLCSKHFYCGRHKSRRIW